MVACRRYWTVSLAGLLLLSTCVTELTRAVSVEPKLLVDTEGWRLKGVLVSRKRITGSYRAFRGIPFAAPPVGDNRWRPPAPAKSWAPRVLDASSFRADCAQLGPCWNTLGSKNVAESSEDCLYLNVYTPTKLSEPLPVAIYVPAGGFKWGAANDVEDNEPFQNISAAVADSVIVVTINYRLSIFGFLGAEELRSRDPTKSTGAYALQDQRAAFAWVKRNIHAFGGDPGRVTIMGESAGAASMTLHAVMPRSWEYFDRMIIESGAFSTWARKPFQHAQQTFDAVVKALNCSSSGEGAVDCLLAQNTSTLLNVADYDYGFGDPLPWNDTVDRSQWAPPVDGVELTDTPNNLLRKGVSMPPEKDLLLGSNKDEGTYFTMMRRSADRSHFEEFVAAQFGEQLVGPVLRAYPEASYPPEVQPPVCRGEDECGTNFYWAATHAVGDYAITCPTRRAMRLLTRGGRRVFGYFFQHTPRVSLNFPQVINNYSATLLEGAFHGAEIPFVLADTVELVGQGELQLSAAMGLMWTNFMRTGDPNKGAPLPAGIAWPQFHNDSNVFLGLDVSDDGKEVDIRSLPKLKEAECSFWDSYPVPICPLCPLGYQAAKRPR